MPRLDVAFSSIQAAGDLVGGLVAGGVTAVLAVAVLVGGGLVLLFRRRDGARPSAASGLTTLRTQANVLLVRADEAVKAGDDELGFAIAQFGGERSREFGAAVTEARSKVTRAFQLRHELDDAFPESIQKQREWTLQIVALCESAIALLAGQDHSFTALRDEEVAAPERLADVQSSILATRRRFTPSLATLSRLADDYAPSLLSAHETAVADATALLDTAEGVADAAAGQLSPAGVNAVNDSLVDAEDAVRRAVRLLDAVDARATELDAATAALSTLVATARADLTEARVQREAAPDPATSEAINDAISGVEAALAGVASAKPPTDPITSLDAIGAAVAVLDAALASARNQKQRLDHAVSALGGTLASAKSQFSAISAFIAVGGRRVGADARTRLAQAERELIDAQAAGADPVEALDAARRAVTHLRDADALARYDAGH
ncbi:hypothetical protein EYE40_09155 [Glaciihabitans arcticus]|uniref:TPM domain-containing protein n=1 Tax=Glaciihabitans arcticus TaxID=2668039 RepID=A0A4Q9GSA6_9MICO|nr:hypothetical protein [Glaciihabitans arcticus]TBN57541.1 hypothetical protein EYE40_09155 [Glaciihabitans arcticus]